MEKIELTIADTDRLLSMDHFQTMVNLMLPAMVMYNLRKNIDKMHNDLKAFNETRKTLLSQHCEMEGETPKFEDNKPVFKTPGDEQTCMAKIIEISNVPLECEIYKIPINIKDLPKTMSMAFFAFIELFLEVSNGEGNG